MKKKYVEEEYKELKLTVLMMLVMSFLRLFEIERY